MEREQIRNKLIDGRSFQVRQRFPGAYGTDAMEQLIAWSDNLFASTMSVYRENAITACTPPATDACSKAVKARHAPEPKAFDFYDLVNPYVTCPDPEGLERVGNDGEGGKKICADLLQTEDCVVFSLGSNGQFDFEVDILETTDCLVYTFDCTYDGTDIDGYDGRHTYLKKCIGSKRKSMRDERFVTLEQATRQFGINQVTLLKMDIEGSEFDEMAGWSIRDASLPVMIAVEIHRSEVIYDRLKDERNLAVRRQTYGPAVEDLLIWTHHDLDLGDLALFFGSLARLGYAVVNREDNPIGRCCTELLLLRVVDIV